MSDEPEPQVFTELESKLVSDLGYIHNECVAALRSAAADLDPTHAVSPEVRSEAFSALLAVINTVRDTSKP